MDLQFPMAGIASAATAVGRWLSQSASVLSACEEKEWTSFICHFPEDGDELLPGGSQVIGQAGSPRNTKRRTDYPTKQGRAMDWKVSRVFSPRLGFPKQSLHSSSKLSSVWKNTLTALIRNTGQERRSCTESPSSCASTLLRGLSPFPLVGFCLPLGQQFPFWQHLCFSSELELTHSVIHSHQVVALKFPRVLKSRMPWPPHS